MDGLINWLMDEIDWMIEWKERERERDDDRRERER
jgi:hypothetical protein